MANDEFPYLSIDSEGFIKNLRKTEFLINIVNSNSKKHRKCWNFHSCFNRNGNFCIIYILTLVI